MLYLTILLFFIFFAGVAMTVGEGLWSNTVSLFSILLAGLFGVVLGVPLGNWIVERADASTETTWYFIFGMVWLVFAVSVTVIRLLVDNASRFRLKFIPLLDKIAGPLMGLFVAVMFTSFAAYTLERIPLQAGEWNISEAEDWQKSTFTYARAPFLNIAKIFMAAEGADVAFVSK